MSPGTPTLNGLSSSNRLSKNTLCWMSNLVTQAQWRCVYEACLCADIADSCPRNKNEMDALQDNLIHFHWQDVISDTEECRERWVSAPRGGGAQERMEEKPDKKDAGRWWQQWREIPLRNKQSGEGEIWVSDLSLAARWWHRTAVQPWRWVLISKMGTCDFLSDWTRWRLLTQNPVLGLEIVNHSSHWGGMKAGSG